MAAAAETIPFATRRIGRTGLEVSALGLGTGTLGAERIGVTIDEAKAVIAAAWAAGVRYIDTAPYYGLGKAERCVGDAMREVPRDDWVLSTKAGRLLRPQRDTGASGALRHPLPFDDVFDYSYDGVMRSWQESLARLRLPRVDLLYVHDIGRLTHAGNHQAMLGQLREGGGLRALAELRAGRQISAFGIGVNEIDVCLEVLEEADLDVILLAGRYTLLEQEALDRLLPECCRRGTSIVIGGPYNSGILATGTGSSEPRFNYEPAPRHIIERVRRIEGLCERHGVTLAAAALQFPLAHPLVASVIPGLGRPDRVAETLSLYRRQIPIGLWQDLKLQGLIRADAPTPGGGA